MEQFKSVFVPALVGLAIWLVAPDIYSLGKLLGIMGISILYHIHDELYEIRKTLNKDKNE